MYKSDSSTFNQSDSSTFHQTHLSINSGHEAKYANNFLIWFFSLFPFRWCSYPSCLHFMCYGGIFKFLDQISTLEGYNINAIFLVLLMDFLFVIVLFHLNTNLRQYALDCHKSSPIVFVFGTIQLFAKYVILTFGPQYMYILKPGIRGQICAKNQRSWMYSHNIRLWDSSHKRCSQSLAFTCNREMVLLLTFQIFFSFFCFI